VGFAGEDFPEINIRTLVGRYQSQEISLGQKSKRLYIGDEINECNTYLSLAQPINFIFKLFLLFIVNICLIHILNL
jgi:actin-related protein